MLESQDRLRENIEATIFQNIAGEPYRVERNGITNTWYAQSLEHPYHVTHECRTLSDAMFAADRARWIPLENLIEILR